MFVLGCWICVYGAHTVDDRIEPIDFVILSTYLFKRFHVTFLTKFFGFVKSIFSMIFHCFVILLLFSFCLSKFSSILSYFILRTEFHFKHISKLFDL